MLKKHDLVNGRLSDLDKLVKYENWGVRMKEMEARMQDIDHGKRMHSYDMELVQHKHESLEQAHEALTNEVRKLHQQTLMGPDDVGPSNEIALLPDGSETCGPPAEVSSDVKECMARLERSEAQLGEFRNELQIVRQDNEFASRIKVLITQLKDVAPK